MWKTHNLLDSFPIGLVIRASQIKSYKKLWLWKCNCNCVKSFWVYFIFHAIEIWIDDVILYDVTWLSHMTPSRTSVVHIEVLDAPNDCGAFPLCGAGRPRRVVDEHVGCREGEVSRGAGVPRAPLSTRDEAEGAAWITGTGTSFAHCKYTNAEIYNIKQITVYQKSPNIFVLLNFFHLNGLKTWFTRNVFCTVFLTVLKWVECISVVLFRHDLKICLNKNAFQ